MVSFTEAFGCRLRDPADEPIDAKIQSRSTLRSGRHPFAAIFSFVVTPVAAWSGDASAQAATDASAGALSQFIADRVDRVGDHLGDLARAIPQLPTYFRNIGRSFERATGAASAGRIATVTLLCILVGALAEWGLRRATSDLHARRHSRPVLSTTDRLAVVATDIGIDLGSVLAFAVGAFAVLLTAGRPRPFNEVGSAYLVALVWVRLVLAGLKVLLKPVPGPERAFAAIALDLPVARFWYRSLGTFVGWLAFGWSAIVTLRAFAMPQDGRQLIAYTLGVGLVVIALTIIWSPVRSTQESPAAATAASGSLRWRQSCSGQCGPSMQCPFSGS